MKKATLPKEKWHEPEFYVDPAQSNAQTTEECSQVRGNLQTSTVAFSGMQVHSIVEEMDEAVEETPNMMMDNGSTITLGKD